MLSGRTDYYLMYSFYLEKKVVDELFFVVLFVNKCSTDANRCKICKKIKILLHWSDLDGKTS